MAVTKKIVFVGVFITMIALETQKFLLHSQKLQSKELQYYWSCLQNKVT